MLNYNLGMETIYSRTETLIGKDKVTLLKNSRVIIFGIGGVGSFTVEALARSGVGAIAIVDSDTVNITNINRQLIALHSTIGRPKVEVMAERLADISPNIEVRCFYINYNKETKDKIDLSGYDYIVDAIDTVTSKIMLIEVAKQFKVPIISSMGAGNKLNPHLFQVADIKKTSVCPLARVMRLELKKRNIEGVKVVYSQEIPVVKERIPASISFVPSVVGLLIAAEVVKDIIGEK